MTDKKYILLLILTLTFYCNSFAQKWKWCPDSLFLNPSGLFIESYMHDTGDIDNDGYADIVFIGKEGIKFYRNLGQSPHFRFERRKDWEKGLDNIDGSELNWSFVPTLADLNGDNFCELIFQKRSSAFSAWLNTRIDDNIIFLSADSLIQNVKGNSFFSIADIDHDGDKDAITDNNGMQIYLNIGTPTRPVWDMHPKPVKINDLPSRYSYVRFVNANDDDKIDLAISLDWPIESGYLIFAKNYSTADSFVFDTSPNKLYGENLPMGHSFSFNDLNGDEKPELVTSERMALYKCWEFDPDSANLQFTLIDTWGSPCGIKETGIVVDNITAEGVREFLVFHMQSCSDYWDGYMDINKYRISNEVFEYNRLFSIYGYQELGDERYMYPSIQKVDSGLPNVGPYLILSVKIMTGEIWTATKPVGSRLFVLKHTPNWSGYGFDFDLFAQFKPDTCYYDPKMVDINNDGNMELLMQESGSYDFWENAGSWQAPLWLKRSNWTDGLNDIKHYQAAITDLNQDGLYDIVFSEFDSCLTLYLNVGTPFSPRWQADSSAFADIAFNSMVTPCFYDIDLDDDPDLLFSDQYGEIFCYRNGEFVSKVQDKKEQKTPEHFDIYQNYPNPFNPVTTICYDIPSTMKVLLKLYDITGREILTLVNAEQTAGRHYVRFDGSDLASGIYFYILKAGKFQKCKKMVLVR